jgi:multiple antibiotic resistance protein
MTPMNDYLAATLVTLLVTLDPPGMAPIFLSVTRGMSRSERREVAVRASIIAFLILAFFGLGGDVVLKLLGVSLPAFRIAGGLLLFWIAFEMVFERRSARKSQTVEMAITQDHIRNVAAIPLMAGPGAITAMLLLAGRANGEPLLLATLIAVAGFVILSCLATFILAERVNHVLGVTGNAVLTRLLGVILAAMAVQFTIDGIKAAFA